MLVEWISQDHQVESMWPSPTAVRTSRISSSVELKGFADP